jgi:hypothetical protein
VGTGVGLLGVCANAKNSCFKSRRLHGSNLGELEESAALEEIGADWSGSVEHESDTANAVAPRTTASIGAQKDKRNVSFPFEKWSFQVALGTVSYQTMSGILHPFSLRANGTRMQVGCHS